MENIKQPEASSPNSRMEFWKYSKVESFLKLKHPIHQPENTAALQDLPEDISKLVGHEGHSLIFYNGQFVNTLSDNKLPKGVRFASGAKQVEDLAGEHYLRQENALNAVGGFDLEVNDCPELLRLNLVFLYGNRLESETSPSKIITRSQLKITGKSSVKIFESHIALNELEFSVNQCSSLKLSGSAKLERLRAFWLGDESYFFESEDVSLQGQASVLNLNLQMGGKWSRIEQMVRLESEETKFVSLGGFLLANNSHSDMTNDIEHIVGNNFSEQLYKGIVTESARSAFNGRIKIYQDAQKSSTAQLNQNMVLGSRAEADSKPQLEVYADDVTASHGSTVGGLNEDEIFYLQSRGISKEQATELVAKAFVESLADRLEDKVLENQARALITKGFGRYVRDSLEEN